MGNIFLILYLDSKNPIKLGRETFLYFGLQDKERCRKAKNTLGILKLVQLFMQFIVTILFSMDKSAFIFLFAHYYLSSTPFFIHFISSPFHTPKNLCFTLHSTNFYKMAQFIRLEATHRHNMIWEMSAKWANTLKVWHDP